MSRSRKLWLAVALFAVAAVLVGTTVATAAGPWKVLGERVVNDRLERDTIAVGTHKGTFTAVKLMVLRRPVHFLDVKIFFANGDVQDVELRRVIPAGGESRVIDLVGGNRQIQRVEFWYEAETIGRGKKSLVRLLGRR
jgi:hypothetical protein